MLRGSLFVRLTTSAYQRFANAATVSVARPACASLSACLAGRRRLTVGDQNPALLAPQAGLGKRVRGVFAQCHPLFLRTATTEPVPHAPDRLAGRLHLNVEPASVRELIGALFRLQTLEFRVRECHACPHGKKRGVPMKIRPVPHEDFQTPPWGHLWGHSNKAASGGQWTKVG